MTRHPHLARITLAMAMLAAAAGAAVTTAAQAPDRSRPPVPGAPPVFRPPTVDRRTLANGLRVWVVPMHEVPVVDLTMIVGSGATADPADRFGLAQFTAAMITEGAGRRSALELADAVDFLGASLTAGATFDASNVRLHTLASKLDDALPILADVVLRPAFPASEIERVRGGRMTSLLQVRDSPTALASAAFSRLVFGTTTRYGTPLAGTEGANRAITVADLKAFYSAHYQPQNACLLVVGDVTPAALAPKIDAAFGSWPHGNAAPTPAPTAAEGPSARHIYLLDKPGAAQSEIRIGGVGVARTTPDYHVLDVLNTILGGSFTSRLNMNLREAHGYTYGASSRFDMRRGAGPFFAGAGVQTDKTAPALQEFFKELDGIHDAVPDAELARARNLEALSFPGEFETTRDMAGKLADLAIYGLPDSTFADYVPKVQGVSSADLQRVANAVLHTAAFTVVIVGDVAKIEQPVRDANLGPVTIVTADEVLK